MTRRAPQIMLVCVNHLGSSKEVKNLPNPLAIGVTLGGLFLDIVVPRPKPRAGYPIEHSLLSKRANPRTPPAVTILEEHDGAPVASGRVTAARV